MDLDWFKNLSSLARVGNFSRAAEADHISQSAFSRRIKALEAWAGTSLVDRSSYPVKLTEAGRQILEAGDQAVNRLETERAHIRESLEQPDKYVVSFGTQHSIGWRFFPAWLQSFERGFGPIISRLRADNLPNCLADLHRGEVDFVISYESAHARSVEESSETASLVIGEDQLEGPMGTIQQELQERLQELYEQNKLVEAQRLETRTKYDMEMMVETGYCPGVEEYTRHLTRSEPGEPPWTLVDYFPKEFLLVIDESQQGLAARA